jgi:putative ABC transport system substrate-binding protein
VRRSDLIPPATDKEDTMQRTHRITPAALVLALGLVAAACGDDDDDSATTEPTSAATSAPTSAPTEPEPATTPEPAPETTPESTAEETVAPTEAPSEPEELPTAVAGLAILAPAPALELAASGFKEAAEACATATIEIVERNAEGDIPSLTSIVEGFVGDDVDLIATVTTPAAQAAFQVVGAAGGTPPVVFSVVTDPFAAGLATSATEHEPWITGSQSLPPFNEVIDAAQAVVPDLAVMGMVYNPSEANAQTVVDAIQGIADERGLTLELATIADSSEVGQATEALVGRNIDAFIVPTDTTMVSGMAAMVQIADDNDIPVIGTDANHAQTGAAIGLGTDYYGSGVRAGEIACAVVSGEATPADFDIVPVESLGIAVNLSAAEAQGVTIPDDLMAQAETVG